MRRSLLAATLAATLLAPWPALTQQGDEQSFDVIDRGRYLAMVGDCVACHTIPGGTPYAGGRAIATPFGSLLTPNLTPDQATGIGSWTDDQFVRAMQQGIAANGDHLYPAFPYPYYTRVTRQDALAIRAWLATLQPVRNPVVTNQLPFPFNIRASLIAWNAMFFTPGDFVPHADKSAEWNRGGYFFEGLAHCGACHTPKNLLGGDKNSQALQGYDLQGWVAPSLTIDARTGIGAWSAEDIVEYLKTGRNQIHAASGPMAEVIDYTTSRMHDADLWAIAAYLRDPPQGVATTSGTAPAAVSRSDPAMQVGAAVYLDSCAACHTQSGAGIARLFPALAHAAAIQQDDPASLVHVVLRGARAVATGNAPTGPAMPSFAWKLDDTQVAAVLTYIRNEWGNAAPAVSASTVAAARVGLTEPEQ